jgi:hypothetical protein
MSVVSETASAAAPSELATILASLKTLESAELATFTKCFVGSLDESELFKLLKAGVSEAEKKLKSAGKTTRAEKSAATKKAGSMPKGVVPPQLRKPRAWVEFVLKHALENGWEPFTVYQSRKDKVTGEKVEEEIDMPGSVLHEGTHIYEDSISEKLPAGKQLIQKDAMSLSKHYWAPKAKAGTKPELYEEFEASYVEEATSVDDSASETSSTKRSVVKMTAAEKEARAAEKKAAKEAEKEAKKAEKEAEKEAKKAEKEAEKAAKKAAKEAEKAAKKAEKEAEKEAKPAAAKKAAVPAAAVKKPTASPAAVAVPLPASDSDSASQASVKAAAAKKRPVVLKKDTWVPPEEGAAKQWSYKGKKYVRNSYDEVWLQAADGGLGEWQGVYLPAEDKIDDSAEEPEMAEDEE